ncbi:hypothetical protein ABIB25_005158 [Nakamurella sp. UYEF19]|uniref:hypothetical protein n=1 Tax=Nakamurella sp. UYEF19 TaxID=1756392 RepID=UPI00339104AC
MSRWDVQLSYMLKLQTLSTEEIDSLGSSLAGSLNEPDEESVSVGHLVDQFDKDGLLIRFAVDTYFPGKAVDDRIVLIQKLDNGAQLVVCLQNNK